MAVGVSVDVYDGVDVLVGVNDGTGVLYVGTGVDVLIGVLVTLIVRV